MGHGKGKIAFPGERSGDDIGVVSIPHIFFFLNEFEKKI